MKVMVDANIIIKNVFEPPVELTLNQDSVTLKDLLREINKMSSSLQLVKDETLGEDVRNIFLNGADYFQLPHGLDTSIRDGDKVNVEIYMEPLGGG